MEKPQVGIMIGFPIDRIRSILVLGAHPDDIEIGCGGALLQIGRRRDDIAVQWVVFSGDDERHVEAQNSAEKFLKPFRDADIRLFSFTDGFFPADWSRLKQEFEKLKSSTDPDLILTHYGRDHHQDHRVVSDLTWNTFRNHTVLEYEIPKYDGDFDRPNVFVPIDAEIADLKVRLIMKYFPSQIAKDWFDPEVFLGVMRLRGMECAAPQRFAEAFHARKICLG